MPKPRSIALLTDGTPPGMEPNYWPSLFQMSLAPYHRQRSLLATLCGLFPGRSDWYQREWCRRARTDAEAWDETRATLDSLIAEGAPVPEVLRHFAMVPRPSASRGPRTKEWRDLRFQYVLESLVEDGLTEDEIWDAYRQAFPPRAGVKDPRDSFRDLLRRGRGMAGLLDAGEAETETCYELDVPAPPELLGEAAWSDPVPSARSVLASDCSPFLLAWHLWSERCTPYVELWCVLAKERDRGWVWDGLRDLLNWLVYWDREVSPPLRRFVREPRPKNSAHRQREDARRLRVAIVAHKLEELGHGDAEVKAVIQAALGESLHGIENATVDVLLAEGRDLILDFLFVQRGSGPLPWRE